MPHRLQTLKINRFRGATCPVEIVFDTTRPATLIFGENGTGKSTIVDALDFVFNESIGSFEGKSSVSPKSHAPSLGFQAKDMSIEASFGGQSWSATWGKTTPVCSGPQQNKPIVSILRRDIILKLLNARPTDRYAALQEFIGIPHVQSNEIALREAYNAVKKDLETDTRLLAENETNLKGYWETENKPEGHPETWAKKCLKQDIASLQASAVDAQKIIDSTQRAESDYTTLQREQVQQKIQAAQHLAADNALKEAEAALAGIVDGRTLLALLRDAVSFLTSNPKTSQCPICNNGITPEKVKEDLNARISQMQNLEKAKQILDSAKLKLDAAATRQQGAVQQFAKTLSALLKYAQGSKAQELLALSLPWQNYASLLSASPDSLTPELITLGYEVQKKIVPILSVLESRKHSETNLLNKLNAVKNYYGAILAKRKSVAELKKLHVRLQAMSDLYEGIRKKYVDELLDAISADIAAIYNKIHPGENIGKVRFFLNPKFQGSLECEGQFQDKDNVPPQAYYSESHLDTLGICVFLALEKHFKHENSVVVLDDVVTSVDEAHMTRFITAIQEEADNFNHLIITTHYRPWREMYRYAKGQSGKIHLLELLHWTMQRGVRHTKTRLSVEELKEHLETEPLDRQIVSSKAGILLESLLDHVTYLYECKLPRKPVASYTLGDLFASVSKLKSVLQIEMVAAGGATKTPAKDAITALDSLAWIRNQVGCHWNIHGAEVSNGDVKDFVEKTIALSGLLICPECGEVPRKNGGTHWHCGCGKHKLYPLDCAS